MTAKALSYEEIINYVILLQRKIERIWDEVDSDDEIHEYLNELENVDMDKNLAESTEVYITVNTLARKRLDILGNKSTVYAQAFALVDIWIEDVKNERNAEDKKASINIEGA